MMFASSGSRFHQHSTLPAHLAVTESKDVLLPVCPAATLVVRILIAVTPALSHLCHDSQHSVLEGAGNIMRACTILVYPCSHLEGCQSFVGRVSGVWAVLVS